MYLLKLLNMIIYRLSTFEHHHITKWAGARARNWRKTFVRGNEMGLIKIGTKPPEQGRTRGAILFSLMPCALCFKLFNFLINSVRN